MTRGRLLFLAALGVGIVLCVLAGASQRLPGDIASMDRARTEHYVLWAAAAGGLYAGAIRLVPRVGAGRRALWIVLAAAAAMRVVTVMAPPLLSTDLYRYVWDGRVQAAGTNPYLHIPADPALAPLRDSVPGIAAIYPNINRAEFAPTIYPPAAQALFFGVAVVWPSIWGMKAAMLLLDAIAIGCAIAMLGAARLCPARVLIYAWNPLVVWEFAGGAHIDAAATAFTAIALLAAIRLRPAWAGLALGVAILCKLLPAALFPAFWRRWDWRMPMACGAVIALGYACYARAGLKVFGYLPGYVSEEDLTGQGAFLLRLLGPVPGAGIAYAALCAAGLLALAAWVALRRPLPVEPAARAAMLGRDVLWLGTATMAALSPHYPWYFAGLALPAVLAPVPAVLWLTLAAPVLYLDHGHDELIWPALVFLPSMALLLREWRAKETIDVRHA